MRNAIVAAVFLLVAAIMIDYNEEAVKVFLIDLLTGIAIKI